MIRVAVVGATGNVGRKVVGLLLQHQLVQPQQLKLLASSKTAGQTLSINGYDFKIEETTENAFKDVQVVLFNTESDISSQYVPCALAAGAYVVDSSSHYRLDADVPLIIPPVNQHLITQEKKLYAHANCLASPISTVMAPLHKKFGIRRANAVTYQSTSGAGKACMDECWQETKSIVENKPFQRKNFKRQIAFNVIPQVGEMRDDNFTYEEYKIIHEVQKVIGKEIKMTATAVRVPVMVGHSIVLSLELVHSFSLSDILNTLQSANGVRISLNDYATPVEIVDTDDVHVGRIRFDDTVTNGLLLWLCSDNLRRGAATDAVEIVTKLLQVAS